MAESTLDSELIILIDRWPGYAELIGDDELPIGGWLGNTHHAVSQPVYRPGQKFCAWNDENIAGTTGMFTMIYLQYDTAAAAEVMAAKQVVVNDAASAAFWRITNDPDAVGLVLSCALAAVAISALTDEQWGWFWCGGVCPEGHLPGLAGNYATKDGTVAGALCTAALVADAIGFGPVAADTSAIIGFALDADAG